MENTYIGKLAFSLVYPIEAGEGFEIENSVKKVNNPTFLKNLDRETILSFLELDDTKVKIIYNKNKPVLYAHNDVADESIQIDGLGDHFLALLKVVCKAEKYVQDVDFYENLNLLDHSFIQSVNSQLLSRRSQYGEAAIGEYRYLDFLDRPYEVHHTMVDDNGMPSRSLSANIESAEDQNVIKKMCELVDWVNNVAFKEGRDIMYDIAEFHARFVQIQPFADGNKRTARLLTNYILLIKNLPLVDINEENRDEYLTSIYYATASSESLFRSESKAFKEFDNKVLMEQGERTEENKYNPLKKFFEENCIKGDAKKIIEDILRYDPGKNLHADQVQ